MCKNLHDVENEVREMGIVNWRHTAQDKNGWRRATREGLDTSWIV